MDNQLKIALPKGRLLGETAALFKRADWGLSTYHESMPSYRPKSPKFPEVLAKVFHEKDIPIQVAVGNYDLGICGLDWVEELMVKYPSVSIIKLKSLGYGEGALCAVASKCGQSRTIDVIKSKNGIVRLASEYPNLAEAFALNLRLKRFAVFPLWGAAEAYPPESADLALIPGTDAETFNHGLVPVTKIMDFNAYLIANKDSWGKKDLSQVVASIESAILVSDKKPPKIEISSKTGGEYAPEPMAESSVRIALPDGHQQKPTIELLNKAGIRIDDYPSATGNRRPTPQMPGVTIKVIRPQDMPLQVANGNFDLAITGIDWLTEHLCQFPSSPVTELVDLKYGKVRMVIVVGKELPLDNVQGLRQLYNGKSTTIRVASEYTNIADRFARDNRLGMYRVIPTWGATEAFLPEDADILIENTETGGTIARHNLKIIDTLFESTARLIGNKNSIDNPGKSKIIKNIAARLHSAVG